MSEIKHPEAPGNPLVDKLEEVGHREFCKMVDRGEVPSLTAKVIDSVKYDFIQQQLNMIPEDEMVKIHVALRDKSGAVVRDEAGFAKSEERHVFKRDQLLKKLLLDGGITMASWNQWEKRNVRKQAGTPAS